MSTASRVEPAHVPATPSRGSRRRPGWVLRLLGKTFLTAAFILGAYILWLLWGTGIYYDRQQDGLRESFQARVEAVEADPHRRPPVILPGQAYAILQIPRIDLDSIVVEGTEVEALKDGPGHYAKTADPWADRGRVGIAGHRTTYGAPFWDLDKLRRGDTIRLVTELGTYDYRVRSNFEVLPNQNEVLRQTPKPSLVLTTCTPKFSAARRLIVMAERVAGPLEAAA